MAVDDRWVLVRLSLCLFWINCQPSEPFLTLYLLRDKGLTEDELDNRVRRPPWHWVAPSATPPHPLEVSISIMWLRVHRLGH